MKLKILFAFLAIIIFMDKGMPITSWSYDCYCDGTTSTATACGTGSSALGTCSGCEAYTSGSACNIFVCTGYTINQLFSFVGIGNSAGCTCNAWLTSCTCYTWQRYSASGQRTCTCNSGRINCDGANSCEWVIGSDASGNRVRGSLCNAYACKSGFIDCDADVSSCEWETGSDALNSKKGALCSEYSCNIGFLNCNLLIDGCETSTTVPNGIRNSCNSLTCNEGWYNSDGNILTGCNSQIDFGLSLSSQSPGAHIENNDKIYYNPSLPGSFIAAAISNAPLTNAVFPQTVSSGATKSSSPYLQTYNFIATSNEEGIFQATLNTVSGESLAASFEIIKDPTPPLGGSITHAVGFQKIDSAIIAYSAGTDSGSGIDLSTGTLQRRSSAMNQGQCTTFSEWQTIQSGIGISHNDEDLMDNVCYEYQYSIKDNVGNEAIYSSPAYLKIDRIAPALEIFSPASVPMQKDPVNIQVSFSDTNSGIKETKYCWTAFQEGCTPQEVFQNGETISSQDYKGQLMLCASATDYADNTIVHCSESGAYGIDGEFDYNVYNPYIVKLGISNKYEENYFSMDVKIIKDNKEYDLDLSRVTFYYEQYPGTALLASPDRIPVLENSKTHVFFDIRDLKIITEFGNEGIDWRLCNDQRFKISIAMAEGFETNYENNEIIANIGWCMI